MSESDNENTSNNSAKNNSDSSDNSAKNNNSGKWIIAVIVGGAIWVAVSPIVGAMLVKDKHLELSGKPPEPLNIAKSAGSFGYLNKAREGKPYTLPADLQGSAAAPSTTNSAANAPLPSSSLSGLGLSGSGISGSGESAKVPGKADAEAIRERFRSSIIAMKPTASHPAAPLSSSSSSSSSSLGLEERMNAVTKLCVAGKNAEGLDEADKFLAYIDKTPGIDPQYKVSTAALAMQMADNLHQVDRAKGYSQTAWATSRTSEDYLIEKIEPVYYGLRGSKVNFAKIQQLTKQYESDVANARSADALAQAKQLVAATASLPPQSFFRIKARIFLAHSQFIDDLNESAARRELADIKQTAESVGDQQMAKACQNIINGLAGPI
ncbi:hypothetical protein KA344_18480 [bacterium]|nr:hypothetical protein [bacterium]